MRRIYLVAAQDAFGDLYFVGSEESDEDARASVPEGDTLLSHTTEETLRIFSHGLVVSGQVLNKFPYILTDASEIAIIPWPKPLPDGEGEPT